MFRQPEALTPPDRDSVRLLLVEDDPAVLRAYAGSLARHGVTVEAAASGQEAIARLESGSIDVILTDVSMPGMTGIELLEAVRRADLDVPVILMSGEPDLGSAVRAIELGAFRYLAKPIVQSELVGTVVRAASLHAIARLKREVLTLPGADGWRQGERGALEARLSAGLASLWVAFQPIVGLRAQRVFGFEALLRSGDPAMKSPAEILDAAERLGQLHAIGRAVRALVAEAAPQAPHDAKLFVNLHSADLTDEELYAPDAPLSKIAPRVVLEVTERASLEGVPNVSGCVARLRALGFLVAVDDLGAGYAGLSSFTQLAPEVAKLDMSLVRGVDRDVRRRCIVGSMKRLCDDLGILVIAEGVETAAERDALAAMGIELLHGYLFARPARGFEPPSW